MTEFHELTVVVIAAALSSGMLLALCRCLRAELAHRLGQDDQTTTGLLEAAHLTLIPMMLLSGMLVDFCGVGTVLFLGSVLAALALFLLTRTRDPLTALGAMVVFGAAMSGVIVSSTVLMPRVFFATSPAASVNLGYVFVGLGALLAPPALELMLQNMGFRRALSAFAVLALLPALLAVVISSDVLSPPNPARHAVLGTSLIWLAGLIFALYALLESWLGNAAPRYLADLEFPPWRSSLLLAAVWIAFLAARLLTALLQHQEFLDPSSDPWLVWMLALLAAIGLGHLAGTHRQENAVVGLLLVGALLGPIFPTLVGFVLKSFDPPDQGTACGAVFALGFAGSAILAPAFRVSPARPASIRGALYLLIAVALAAVGTGLALALSY